MSSRGTILCVVTAISVYAAYDGLIPPAWARRANSRSFFKLPWIDTLFIDYTIGFGILA
jgi:hypothetical protein